MLQRKTCVVVGGAKGRGRSLVEKYAGQKYRVAFMDIDKESGNSLKKKVEEEYGRKVFFFNGNVNSQEDRELFVGAVIGQYKRVDCLYYRSDIVHEREENGNEIEDLLQEYLENDSIVEDFFGTPLRSC